MAKSPKKFKKIGIIGMGFVGGTLAKAFEKSCEIISYDKYKIEFNHKEILKKAKIIFLCVPTPMKESGEIDLSAVYDSLDNLKSLNFKKNSKPLIVIRSTVIPGTTDLLEKKYGFNFAFNPEFLREKYALKDFLSSNRVIIGASSKKNYETIKFLYKKVLPDAEYIKTTRKEAEMIKYAANITLASQITIANEIYNICKKLGIDYDEVKKIILLDERIGTNINVPGPDGNFGFGGKCFPKDLNALIYLAKKQGYAPDLLNQVWKSNLKFRDKHDWNDIPGAISNNNKFKTK